MFPPPSHPPEISAGSLLDSGLFRSKEVSWLSFNERVLQEAGDPNVPLIDRLRFLGIYSSNLDEFFRVRVATLKRLASLRKPGTFRRLNLPDPKKTLAEVNKIVLAQSDQFNDTYQNLLAELARNGIRFVTHEEVPAELLGYVRDYFVHEVKPRLMPIMVKGTSQLARLKDHPMYLAVKLGKKKKTETRPGVALIEIPSSSLPRFTVLPKIDGEQLVMYLDDVIRFGLPDVFASLPFDDFDSYAIKFTRDAEIEFDDDVTESIYEKVAEGIREREHGNPVRLNYDASIPKWMLDVLTTKLRLTGDDTLFPGARYHNRKDLMGFPSLGRGELCSAPHRPITAAAATKGKRRNLFQRIRKNDLLLHLPYHSFGTFLDFLREASLDPRVQSISITQYRLSKRSSVAAALMSAVRNGKEVTVVVEPQARFDEGRNIAYAEEFQEAGVRVILGVPSLKVHAKLCLVTRTEAGRPRFYSAIGTGNFNEDTAKLYTDHLLFTASHDIGADVARAFQFLEHPYREPNFKRLCAAPHSLRDSLARWIDAEIENARAGKDAEIFIKINNLSDVPTASLLYRAAAAGVKVRIIARSMFSLITGQPGVSERIKAIGIVDRFLEHSRVFFFANGGDPRFYISSADFLPRNFDARFEVVCPVDCPHLQAELREYLEIQWADNVKARILDADLRNHYRKRKKKAKPVRAQIAIGEFLSGASG